jgi:ornithine carbamoyltransferase
LNNFIDIEDIDSNQLKKIMVFSAGLKAERKNISKGSKDLKKYLTNKVVALLFKKPSTRTRFSFEVGIFQMGGQTLTVSSNEMQISNFESMSDTARVISQYIDMVVLRTDNHSDLIDLANYSSIPIINGLSDKSHPCQVLSDIFTFEEIIGSIENKKVVWLGDSNNVCNSYIQASKKLNFEFVISGPREFLSSEIKSSPKYQYEMHPEKALKNADLIVTDTWYSMHHTKEERKLRKEIMHKYTLTNDLVNISKKNCLVFHCMPIYRNNEITSDVVDNFFEIFLKQAENRLHVQKGIMKWCLT